MKNPIKQETDNSQQAEDWNASFLASRPIELDGKKYLIVDRSFWFEGLAFRKMTVSLIPFIEVTTEPMVKALNLSNPPAGATHYNPRDPRHPFRKKLGELCFAWRSDDSSWVQLKNKQALDNWQPLCPQWIGRIQRQTFGAENPQHQQIPKAAQWDGEGLPPVGVDIEARLALTSQWCPARLLFAKDDARVFEWRAEGRAFAVDANLVDFRPIKTAEQLAAEQREAEVQKVCDRFALFGDEVCVDWKALFGQMYDCGMRFPEEK